ncbi:MAG TPA: helix-turn-helix domain-containing protein [Gemmataceae bacterium]|jgi:AcrR family transcriptional regulator
MSKRPYQLGLRKAASEQTRQRILIAAHDLLAAPRGLSAFTIDAVAKQAGVARMTIYHQFGSKSGLLEALCDSLAVRGGIQQMGEVYRQADPLAALDKLIAIFGGFWESDRVVIRRLNSLGALDPELERVLRGRAARRRQHASALVGRLTETLGRPALESFHEAVAILHTLTGFETFDSLAGAKSSPLEIVPLVQRLARAALGLAE